MLSVVRTMRTVSVLFKKDYGDFSVLCRKDHGYSKCSL